MSDARSEVEYDRTEAHGEISRTRRAFLKGGVATSLAASGMLNTWPIFAQTSGEITPFAYRAPQSALDNLRQRLAHTRWPDPETVKDWSQGAPIAKLRSLVEYWRTGFSYRLVGHLYCPV